VNITPTTKGLTVRLPNGQTIQSTHTALLDIPALPKAARLCHIFPDLKNKVLLSIGQFCDSGFTATFTKSTLRIYRNDTVYLQGQRSSTNGLWYIDLARQRHQPDPVPPQQANNLYELTNKRDIATYLHKACFSPVPSTWIKAIDAGFFATWPGLTTDLINKHLPKSEATAKGHLRTARANQRSTKSKPTNPHTPIHRIPQMTTDPPAGHPVRQQECNIKTIDVSGKVYSDQTGRFPHASSKGSKYVMVLYDFDSNAILAEPIKNKTEREQLVATTKLHDYLRARGLSPTMHVMDNECPPAIKKYFRANNIRFQLVPPHIHRTNAAEKAIGTFKDHFVAGLCSVHPQFPMHLWCRLLPLATTTLNLLRPSRVNPKLSAEALLNGTFDYNRTPLAPPGTKVLVHETPAQRKTWAPHGVDGWYIGAAPDHYRCHRTYIPATRKERIARTVQFFPHNFTMPKTSSADAAIVAAQNLVFALQNPTPASPFAAVTSDQAAALDQLSQIFLGAPKNDTGGTDTPLSPKPPRVARPTASAASPPQAPERHTAGQAPRVPATQHRHQPTTPSPQNPDAPNLIAPDDDDPVLHRYPLRSQRNQLNLAQEDTPNMFLPHPPSANSVVDTVTGNVHEYRHLIRGADKAIWTTSFANDLGRLAQGIGKRMPTGTNTIFFVHPTAIPKGRKVTYARIVATIRPHKDEKHRVRVTVGGDKLDYPGITATDTASLTTFKLLINSVISTNGARFLTLDIKDYYYNTPMPEYEYMRIQLDIIPEEVINQYNLRALAVNGWVYLEIRKGMPGLKQAGRIANDRLTKHLLHYGYAPTPRTPALWKHHTLPISFTLVVDDFGVKFCNKHDATHLINALRDMYTISIDHTGSLYCGLTLDWDYAARHVDISMPDYIQQALHRFKHPLTAKPEDAPHHWTQPTYGAKTQFAAAEDASPTLPPSDIKHMQQVIGTLLYYALAIDNTMLVALGDLASAQTKGTQKTLDAVTWLLNYAATHPDATIRYHASGMILHVHSDGSYLSAPKARSRAGGHFFLSDAQLDPAKCKPNGPIHITAKILRNVMASAAEAEIGASYVNGQEAIPIRNTLEELGHPQPPTPMQVDNTTAVGFANNTIKQKRSKAIDMRFYWIQDRTKQGQFHIYWRPGSQNLGDYHTKHHSPAHHRLMRPTYLHTATQCANALISLLLRGCVKPGIHARAKTGLTNLQNPETACHAPVTNARLRFQPRHTLI
jgi:hypothetical protein